MQLIMKLPRTGELVAILCVIGWLAGDARAAGRFNLFDPLFADDDSDAHTVSAGSSGSADTNRRVLEIRNKNASVIGRRAPLIAGDGDSLFSSTSGTTASAPTVSTTGLARTRIESAIALSTPVAGNNRRHLTQDDYVAASSRPKKQTEKPEHWSALESYYETLRKANSQPVNPQYQIVPNYLAEQKLEQTLQSEGKVRPIYAGKPVIPSVLQRIIDGGDGGVGGAGTKSSSAWSLPSAHYQPTYSVAPSYTLQQHHHQQSNDFGLSERPIFIQRATQATGDRSSQGTKNTDGFHELMQKPIDSGYTNAPVAQFWAGSSQARYPMQQLPMQHLPADFPPRAGDVSYSEFLQAQDILHTAQLKNKEKSWEEILDPAFDRDRLREQLELESYCGPRNKMQNLDLSYELAESGKSLNSARINELLMAAKPSAFPSHMGLYNGSSAADDSYLCAASWVHERFALTLASCIPRKPVVPNKDPMLTIRAGEWRAFRPSAPANSGSDQRPLAASSFTRRIKNVHIFPRYLTNSSEHNLALLEWAEPSYFMSNYSFISPACPLRTRHALPASGSCWAPVRNISFSEYFDAEGEGETKLKRNVGMKQVPIRLLNDDTECRRETQLEFFNFQHPNYICSADISRSKVRASLNQTDSFGSGVFCYDGAQLTLVSIIHPAQLETPSQFGYMDLTYYRPWVQSVISSSRATI